MKICIYGAGAIGGYLGVQLARAGVDVSLTTGAGHGGAGIDNVSYVLLCEAIA